MTEATEAIEANCSHGYWRDTCLKCALAVVDRERAAKRESKATKRQPRKDGACRT